MLYSTYIYKCENTHFFSKFINYLEENLIFTFFFNLFARKELKSNKKATRRSLVIKRRIYLSFLVLVL